MNNKFKIIKVEGKEYKFNRYLFLFGAIIILSLFFNTLIEYRNVKNNYYMQCDYEKCFNEYYNSSECGSRFPNDKPICTQEFFFKGQTDGMKPSFMIEYGFTSVMLFILVLLLFNHFMYNKNYFGGLK